MPRFCFAWVDPEETTFGPEHHVVDENIQSLEFSREEGELPNLSISIKNPRVGPLAPGRKTWSWLSWDDDTTVTPIFFGQIGSIPDNIIGEVITYILIAKPLDYEEQKTALAETLKVLPYYDPIFIDEAQREDPDTVLEGYSRLWHVDPITHEVTASDILVGEDGSVDFTEDEVPYDSMSINIAQNPRRSVSMDAAVNWTQQATGTVELPPRVFLSYSGDGIIADWPKPLASLGDGWSVEASSANDDYGIGSALTANYSFSWDNKAKEHDNGDTLSVNYSISAPQIRDSLSAVLTEIRQFGVIDAYSEPQVNIPASFQQTKIYVPLWKVSTTLTLKYEAARQRTERIKFTLTADAQPFLQSDGEDLDEEISKNGTDVGLPIDATPPIVDVSRRSYFPTDRGLQSLEYLINVARSHLLLSSRAIHVSFNCRMERVLALTCRKNARLFDSRLPGGVALGKVISSRITADGPPGKIIGNVTIACAIGHGNAVSEVAGTPDYVEEGVLELGIQTYTGGIVVLPAGDVGYSIPPDAASDDGIVFPLTRSQAINFEEVHGTLAEQAAAIKLGFKADTALANADSAPPVDAAESIRQQNLINDLNKRVATEQLKATPIWYELRLNQMTNGPFDKEYNVTVTDLMVPKMIDLEASLETV